jgi:hypothetical protein
MPFTRVQFLSCAALVSVVLGTSLSSAAGASAAPAATPPPAGAGFDYQIGGAYDICYVNAFQAQPDAEDSWGDLLLRNASGAVVYDEDWGEALLDLRTDDKRQRVAAKVNAWADQCAAKGYQAVEPDNYDSFTRSQDLLSAADAQAYIRLLSSHAHEKGLAIAQKNTSELSGQRVQNGLDFAVAEECGEQKNCGEFTSAFGDHVIVIEYTDEGLATACDRWGNLSIVERDRDVSPKGSGGYVRKTC